MHTTKTVMVLLAAVARSWAIAPNTQSCTCTDKGFAINAYGVTIGITYANGIGCNDVYNTLEDAGLGISNWQCVDDGNGDTQLYFNSISFRAADLNNALHSLYPTVDGFNCPDY